MRRLAAVGAALAVLGVGGGLIVAADPQQAIADQYAYTVSEGDVIFVPAGVSYSVVTGGVPSTPSTSPSPSSVPTSSPPSSATSSAVSPTASPTVSPTPSPSPTSTPTSTPPAPTPTAPASPTPPAGAQFIGPDPTGPTSGPAWTALKSWADKSVTSPSVDDQDDPDNVITLAKALVYARTGEASYRAQVVDALTRVQSSGIGRALALGRELGAYVLAADYIGYRDPAFVAWVSRMRTVHTDSGPSSLIECHDVRANNWGTHCGASRVIADLYLGDTADLAKAVKVWRGWLGDRAAYAGFEYGDDTSWQTGPFVGVNPKGAIKNGVNLDGVLPDDARRGGSCCVMGPTGQSYTWEALQGVMLASLLIPDSQTWSDAAVCRAYAAAVKHAGAPSGDDAWQPSVANALCGTNYAENPSAGPGKGVIGLPWLLP